MSSSNPDPARITPEMWKLWIDRANQAWLLSGIYADKKGYHNTVTANQKKWPGTYSIELAIDLRNPKDKARAIDLTMSDKEMVKVTGYLKRSALDPRDHRLDAVREFYGTLDNKTVYGLIHDGPGQPWRKSSADKTHLWHVHKSIFTMFVNNWDALAPIISVEAGQTLEEWIVTEDMLIQLGDQGEIVKYWQSLHNAVLDTVTPPAIKIENVDGSFGAATASAFADYVHKGGGQEGFTGNAITSWLALRYQNAFIKKNAPVADPASPIDDVKLKEFVDQWLTEHISDDVNIVGTIQAKIEL